MSKHLLLLALVTAPSSAAFAETNELKLGPIWSDNIVIQRDATIVVEGSSAPSAEVRVTFAGSTASSAADANGNWRVELPPMAASGPFVLTVSDNRNGSLRISDVMLGDVWLCSGQSNMELPVSRALDFEGEMSRAHDPMMRLLTVPKAAVPAPASGFSEPAQWRKASRDSVPDFSAACYFMAKDLRRRTGVAIGLVDASWGGTQIKAWLSPDATRKIYGSEEAELLKSYNADALKATTIFTPKWEAWWRDSIRASGVKASFLEEPWKASSGMEWKPVPSIEAWDNWPGAGLAEFNGWVWAKRDVTLSAKQAKQEAILHLGVIDDMDQSWVNGKAVGNSFGWSLERKYRIPAGYFKAGANNITIAIGDSWGAGGFQGPASKLKLEFADGSVLPLGDNWHYSKTNVQGSPPRTPWDTNAGLGLIHNGMIAPLGKFRFKGAAWYQGESDVGLPGYDKRLAALVEGWRAQFDNSALPVAIVSLANFGAPSNKPTQSGWAQLREEQRQAARAIPGTALVQAIDIGDRTDIHPANKNELGKRLGRAAAILTGIEKTARNGPQVESAHRSGNDIIVTFSNVNGRLSSWSADGAIGFEFCGTLIHANCHFVTAFASGNSVRIPDVPSQASEIRYAWADSPVVNLYDSDGLPAEPFRIGIGQ